ncbi:hypothetical protein PHMEG_00012288 [Phytophthora megakarya]|uniref:Retrotransposon gag domain-containing protein n=1 Tax=Phytophthora megakarya TaxID=4795 RepID=A0A225WA30_9STRA|nr:hypothetical protein PHMEG_00012288 [Phytophthora megakarya]
MLLRAMGCEPQRFPSDAALDDWAMRKKKLRIPFGVEEIAPGCQVVARQAFMPADPSKIPLPQTPIKSNETSQGVFGSKGSPYMHDSHVVTPRSVSRQERAAKENESSKRTPYTYRSQTQPADRRCDWNEDSSDEGDDLLDNDCLEGDITEEWARQIRELSARETKNSTPLLEIATHLPLGNIKQFSEREIHAKAPHVHLRHERDTHPAQRLVYGFELSLQDGALHWYHQLPLKTRRTWKLQSDAFIKYYCSKFNQSAKARYYSAKREDKEHHGYARNAGVQFEKGGRESKDHVEHFLDTCDDRGLEERLCHVRVNDIHDLEDMINDILKRRDRKTKRETSAKRSHGHDNGRRRDSGRNEDSRGSYRRDNHHRDDRRRDESPFHPRITLADALSDLVTALNETSVGAHTSQSGQYDHGYETNEDSLGDGDHRNDDDNYSNGGSEYDYAADEEKGLVAAANEYERRAAAEGTFARPDNRQIKGDGSFGNEKNHTRNGRQQYGPCAACGGLIHSVYYCYKRCKLCKQVHDVGKCEAFNELACLLRSKVDKNNLTPMLQNVVPPTETGLVPIGLPQLTELAVDADYLFAFAGEVRWPEDRELGVVNTTEIVEKMAETSARGRQTDQMR